MKNWTKWSVEIDLNFENPLDISRISTGKPPDYVLVEVKDTSYFESISSNAKLLEKDLSNGLSTVVPRQLPKGVSE